jgi:hypothetical protein
MIRDLNRLNIVAIAIAFLASPAHGGQESGRGRMLFKRTDSNPVPFDGADPSEPEDILSRSTILVDWEALREVREEGVGTLGLDAGGQGDLTANVTRVTANSGGGYSLSGSLAGYPESRFVATVHGDALVASASKGGDAGGDFEIIVNRAGRQELREVDNFTMPGCGVSLVPATVAESGRGGIPSGLESAAEGEVAEAEEETTVIDVMVVYTTLAREVGGGVNAMIASINHAVENANLVFINSGVSVLYRLVHTHEVAYDELSTSSEDLGLLLGKNDGHLDEVHGLRDTYGADMVSLWTGNDYGGRAYQMTNVSPGFESYAFNVCGASYTRTLFKLNYLFSHECGHVMGCDHDLASTPYGSPYAFPYSFGWRWTGTDQVQYRCIMSYEPGTIAYLFSNPNINYKGTPTGTDTANNALTINNTRDTVAGFRNSVSTLPVLHLSPVGGSVSSRGGAFSFRVVASWDWTWQRSPGSGWVSTSEANPQSGSQVFNYSVAANPLGARTATITVTSGDSSVVYRISQAGSTKKAALQKTLGKLRIQLKEARRLNQASMVKRLNVRIRKLTSQLRRL